MKIAIMSDLHLDIESSYAEHHPRTLKAEFYQNPPQPKADLLVLAGNIYSGSLVFDWAHRHFALPTILIGGNHECFGHELFRTIFLNRQKTHMSDGRVVYLERDTWYPTSPAPKGVRFIGATLWTDFQLYGTRAESMATAESQIKDFTEIKVERGYKLRKLQPLDTVRIHRSSVAFLRNELACPFDGVTVVVTHYAPSPRSIAPQFEGDPLNPAAASNLERLILRYQPALWIHGHLLSSSDYMIGQTRVICNPRGYFPKDINPLFDPDLTVEVGQMSSESQASPRSAST